jgi:hypothetical protein
MAKEIAGLSRRLRKWPTVRTTAGQDRRCLPCKILAWFVLSALLFGLALAIGKWVQLMW